MIVASSPGTALAIACGHILEQFLDEVDVREDHAAAAVAAEAELVDGVAGGEYG